MKQVAWMSAGILALAGLASPGVAQESRQTSAPAERSVGLLQAGWSPFRHHPRLGAPSAPCPPSSSIPTTPETPSTTPPTTTTPTSAPDFSGAGEFKGSTGRTNSAFAGTGIGGAVSGDPIVTGILTPLILPGLITATGAQSAVPVDRVYFEYGFVDRVAVRGVGTSAPVLVRTPIPVRTVPAPIANALGQAFPGPFDSTVSQSSAPVAGFNLHTFNFGIEKTFFDGLASAYVQVPILYATDNISGQDINGFGDVNLGFKVILVQTLETGNTITGGLTISFPTAHASVSQSFMQSGNGFGDKLLPSTSVSVNPTYFQPWVAGLFVFDRLFIHEYFAFVVPTDDRVATFINNDFTVGYSLYRSNDGGFVSSVTPTVGIQALIPLNNRGSFPAGLGTTVFVPFNQDGTLPPPPAPNPFTFTDQVFASAGVQLGLGDRWSFSANVVVPISGPRAHTVGAAFGLNYFY